MQSRTFARKSDAERFLRQIDADSLRGQWVDPRDADIPAAAWAEQFLLLCRRLSPTTQETYRRDLEKYVLPRFGAYRLGQVPADERSSAARTGSSGETSAAATDNTDATQHSIDVVDPAFFRVPNCSWGGAARIGRRRVARRRW